MDFINKLDNDGPNTLVKGFRLDYIKVINVQCIAVSLFRVPTYYTAVLPLFH